MLLARSGLDEASIERAHTYAESAWKEIGEKMGAQASEKWLATPEGQEAHRHAEEAHRQRLREFWREDCKDAGRILPDPTAT